MCRGVGSEAGECRMMSDNDGDVVRYGEVGAGGRGKGGGEASQGPRQAPLVDDDLIRLRQ